MRMSRVFAALLPVLLTILVPALAAAAPHDPKDLDIGKVAPEIQGKDVEGKSFKLSDYRGKVVVLDFWGDW
jgi:cytochrome oxidase Cu insertion factor (SCO1/SenC/PrrC family)